MEISPVGSEGNVVRAEHPLNARDPMMVRLRGRASTVTRLEHPSNADAPILVSESGKVTDASFVQPLNALLAIAVVPAFITACGAHVSQLTHSSLLDGAPVGCADGWPEGKAEGSAEGCPVGGAMHNTLAVVPIMLAPFNTSTVEPTPAHALEENEYAFNCKLADPISKAMSTDPTGAPPNAPIPISVSVEGIAGKEVSVPHR